MTGVNCGAASRAGLASSRVLVADSDVSTPANAAAAITALMNFNITAPRLPPSYRSEKQRYEPAERQSIFVHHVARCSCFNTLATIGGNSCSTPVTHR